MNPMVSSLGEKVSGFRGWRLCTANDNYNDKNIILFIVFLFGNYEIE